MHLLQPALLAPYPPHIPTVGMVKDCESQSHATMHADYKVVAEVMSPTRGVTLAQARHLDMKLYMA